MQSTEDKAVVSSTVCVQLNLRGLQLSSLRSVDWQKAVQLTGVGFEHLTLLDLSGNALSTLECAEVFERLQSVDSVLLHNNRLATVQSLAPLRSLRSLKHLTLATNPIAAVEHYSAIVKQLLPSICTLDAKHWLRPKPPLQSKATMHPMRHAIRSAETSKALVDSSYFPLIETTDFSDTSIDSAESSQQTSILVTDVKDTVESSAAVVRRLVATTPVTSSVKSDRVDAITDPMRLQRENDALRRELGALRRILAVNESTLENCQCIAPKKRGSAEMSDETLLSEATGRSGDSDEDEKGSGKDESEDAVIYTVKCRHLSVWREKVLALLTEDNCALRTALRKLKRLKAENKQLTTELKAATQRNARLEMEKKSIEESSVRFETFAAQMSDEIKSCERKWQRELEKFAHKCGHLNVLIQQLATRFGRLRGRQLAKMQTLSQTVATRNGEIKTLNVRVENAKVEIGTLQATVSEKTAHMATESERKDAAQSELKTMRGSVSVLKRQLSDLRADVCQETEQIRGEFVAESISQQMADCLRGSVLQAIGDEFQRGMHQMEAATNARIDEALGRQRRLGQRVSDALQKAKAKQSLEESQAVASESKTDSRSESIPKAEQCTEETDEIHRCEDGVVGDSESVHREEANDDSEDSGKGEVAENAWRRKFEDLQREFESVKRMHAELPSLSSPTHSSAVGSGQPAVGQLSTACFEQLPHCTEMQTTDALPLRSLTSPATGQWFAPPKTSQLPADCSTPKPPITELLQKRHTIESKGMDAMASENPHSATPRPFAQQISATDCVAPSDALPRHTPAVGISQPPATGIGTVPLSGAQTEVVKESTVPRLSTDAIGVSDASEEYRVEWGKGPLNTLIVANSYAADSRKPAPTRRTAHRASFSARPFATSAGKSRSQRRRSESRDVSSKLDRLLSLTENLMQDSAEETLVKAMFGDSQ